MSQFTLHDVLAQFREAATSSRDLGDRFERLIARYLELDPLYAERFSNVWLWNEWPQKGKVGDVGIDLVAEERATGGFCAIQCKFYRPEHTLAKDDIDSFFTAAGKSLFTSCLIVSTTDRWGKNAEHALANQSKPVTRLSVHDLEASPIDWSRFRLDRPQDLSRRPVKQVRPHQKAAIDAVAKGFAEHDRGKLIMACGTGKTFTALRLAEKVAPSGHVLFLVPSLALLSQTLREWTAEALRPLVSLAVCSDSSIGKSKGRADDDGGDIDLYDLAFPATTSAKQLVAQHDALAARHAKKAGAAPLTVVFSTYQSIAAVAAAQKAGLPEFDLIICDEAHRTTGVTLSGEDESHFVKVHDAAFMRGKKRLYMTATPRLYGDEAKTKAQDADAALCSMDDPALFGPEFHRLGFGEAVGQSLLADYKVLVLAVDEKYVSKTFQRQIADANNELNLDDAVRITGCWNGLAKRFDQASVSASATDLQGDTGPMRRAVAFSRSIKDSKAFVEKFGQIVAAYRETHPEAENLLACELDHVDGTFDALRRNARIDWLKAEAAENTCRILSNARCLSEGVDVPALDAVLFLNPRKSIIDVVQSVGRVMRRAEGKKYGYIILPIGIPADVPPEEALKDNEKYKVVWQVLQALRAHDDRFNATVNHIELNKQRPDAIQIIGVGGGGPGDEKSDGDGHPTLREVQGSFAFPHLEEWKDAIYARIVLKCGDRRYWESWAKDVAVIAEKHTTRIRALLSGSDAKHKKAFADFLASLRDMINPAISEADAIEMLSQHLITRPVFDALFEGYVFTQHNPVSKAMQSMLDLLHEQALEKETAGLQSFYASVRSRAAGIDNAEGRQRVVIELYDKFFRTAFPKMAERLGIVYTPIEVVDFIIRSVEDVLRHEFGSSLGDKDVHVIDPFTGTGTFLVRLLQSGLIPSADLLRKYKDELHANEIVLLAYYIAAINIEETFHGLHRATGKKPAGYVPFDGIVLTDTFQMAETKGEMEEKMFPENNRRVKRQKQSPIRVVVGNPPYSVNDNPVPYPILDARITSSYAENSTATLKSSLYDSYVRAIRWASDRISGRGVIGFVTNGSFIDGNAMEGLRASLVQEFTSLYVFNLRGNQRTSGETSRMEGGKIFGSGSRTPVAISIFVRNPEKKTPGELHYHDIGDYLSREEKLAIIRGFGGLNGLHRERKWVRLMPNASHDWINQRDPAFGAFLPLGERDRPRGAVFSYFTNGIKTGRDAWAVSFSKVQLAQNMRRHIENYNQDARAYQLAVKRTEKKPNLEQIITNDSKRLHWNRAAKEDAVAGRLYTFDAANIRRCMYRPFTGQNVYTDSRLNDLWSARKRFFPSASTKNVVICAMGVGASKDFGALVTDTLPDLELISKGYCFPLFLYEKNEPDRADEAEATKAKQVEFLTKESEGEFIDGYHRRSAITRDILGEFRAAYEPSITEEDVFYYVYGVLHSPEYRTRFASDLKKMLPRLPLTRETADFWKFSQAGRDLAYWHLNYEMVEPWPLKEHATELLSDPTKDYLVQKMTYGRPTPAQKAAGAKFDKTTLHYNARITLTAIPLDAYDYVVNGKPALDWIVERYQVTVDKDSGIRNDPNDWAREHNQPRYILDLFKRVIRVSLETNRIVASLPSLNERRQVDRPNQ